MENVIHCLTLELSAKQYEVVQIKQYDINSRELIIKLVNNGTPYFVDTSTSARIKYEKSDGTTGLEDCTVLDDGTIKVIISEQMTACEGINNCELLFNTTDKVLHSMNFGMNIRESVFPDGVITSSNEYIALENALMKVDKANEVVDEALKGVDEAVASINKLESTIKTSENTRVSAENSRKSAESIRQANEKARVAEFEEMKEIVAEVDDVFDTASGTSILLQNSIDDELVDFKMYGGSSQKSYSGKNLFDINGDVNVFGNTGENAYNSNSVSNNVLTSNIPSATTNGAGQKIKVNIGDTITFSSKIIGFGTGTIALMMIYENGKVVKSVSTSKINSTQAITYTTTTEEIIVTFATEGNNTGAQFTDIQVEIGSVATDYEPFTNAQPSPNPSYKQPIKSKGDCGWFDGELLQGYYSYVDGIYTNAENRVCNKNKISCKPNDEIILSYADTARILTACFYDKNDEFISSSQKSVLDKLTIIAPSNTAYFRFSINNENVGITPSTAKKIVVTINGTYAVKVKSVNKNLWKCGDINFTQISGAYDLSLKAGTYTFSALVTSSGTDNNVSLLHFRDANDVVLIKHALPRNQRTSFTFTIQKDISHARFYAELDYNSSSGDTATWTDIQIEVGSTATDYEPHKSHTEWIPLSEPLRGIGEGTDTIKPTDGVYRGHRKIKKIVLNGSEGFARNEAGEKSYFYLTIGNYGSVPAENMCLSTHFIRTTISTNTTNVGLSVLNSPAHNSAMLYIRPNNVVDMTINEFNTWLAENKPEVYYVLVEEEIEELEQTPFRNIQTYNSTTYITATDDPQMEVKYYKNSIDGTGVHDVIEYTTSVLDEKIDSVNSTLDSKITTVNTNMLKKTSELDNKMDVLKDEFDNQFQVLTGSPILAQGSADGYMPSFTGKGGSLQKSYSGKNLMKISSTTNTSYGVTFTVNEDGSVTANGESTSELSQCYFNISDLNGLKIEAGKTYTLSANSTNSNLVIYSLVQRESNPDYWSALSVPTSTETTFTVPEDVTAILVRVVSLTNGAVFNNDKIYPMISVEGGDFEPYVGAQPSPNPSYPQPIKSKGDGGWFDGELLQGAYASATGALVSTVDWISNKNIIPCKEDDSITVSYDENCECGILYYDSDMNYLTYKKDADISSLTSIAPTNAKYFNFSIGVTGITPSNAKKIVVTINGTYAVKVTSRGKNELNCNEITSYSAYGVTFTPVFDTEGKLQYVNVNGTATQNAYYNFLVKSDFEEGYYTLSGCPQGGSDTTYDLRLETGGWPSLYDIGNGTGTITNFLSKDKTYSAYICVKQGVTVNNLKFYPMVRRAGITDDTYEPYKFHTEWIPLSEPLRGIGEVTDGVKAVDGLYRCHRKFKEVMFDGSADWVLPTSFVGAVYVKTLPYGLKPFGLGLCDKFTYVSSDYAYNKGKFMIDSNSIRFWIQDTAFESIDEVRSWFNENPVTVLYEIAEEEIEELDQTPFYRLKTFEGATHISASDDMEMEIEVPTSRAGGVASIGWSKGNLAQIETQNLSAKIAELQTAMVNM